jgi:hypothetical protein
MKKFTLDVRDDQINLVCKFLDIIPGVEEYDLHPNFKELADTESAKARFTSHNTNITKCAKCLEKGFPTIDRALHNI